MTKRATAPLGLDVLANLAGIAHKVPDVYTAAVALATDSRPGDCNATYVAIDDLRETIFPGATAEEDRLQADTTMEESDAIGSIIANTKDAAFLLGLAYAYVLIGAFAGREGGAR